MTLPNVIPNISQDNQRVRSSAWRRLSDLKASELLIENYQEVRLLLAELDEAQQLRAGHMLARLNVDALLARHPGLKAATVAIVGNATVKQVVELLTVELARHQILLRSYVGGYGEYLFDLESADSPLYAARPELTLCLLDAHAVFDELRTPWNVADVEQALDAMLVRLSNIVSHHRENSSGTLLLNTLPLPRSFMHQLLDYSSRMNLGAAWRDFNAKLLRLGTESERLIVVDLDVLLTESGRLGDARMSVYAKAHFSDEMLTQYAREAAHVLRSLGGLGKKCLIVDLDGTLWGGVLGDAGIEGIQLGGYGEGQAFLHFQRTIRQLASQGVLLAVCSKNDEQAVRSVLRDHPEMDLRDEDFSIVKANWDPKSENIVDIARQLNIGIDSMVFVDDSPFECGLVAQMLPEVAVIHLDGDPALYAERLLSDGWFTVPRLTVEDYDRRQQYAAEGERKQFQEGCATIGDYLAGLKIHVHLCVPARGDIARIAQITQRTNQFNLTTRRMDTAEVSRWLNDSDCRVWMIRSRDRFSDNGIVGVIFVRCEKESLAIENMLLSCRVFSRGIESACLTAVLEYAKAHGMQMVRGSYKESAKNMRFADFFTRHGFADADFSDQIQHYLHDLQTLPSAISHINMLTSLEKDNHD